MRNLWVRIGLGAAFVFAAGMFFVTLGRQVKNSVVTTMEDGGRFRVPLSLIPFSIDHQRVGHVQEVDVRRGLHGPKQINVTVRLKHQYQAESWANCLFVLDSPRAEGLFSCLPEDAAEAADYLEIGELRIHPGNLVRPLVIGREHAEDWLEHVEAERVSISASDDGAVIKVTDAEGTKVVDLKATSNGANIKVTDADGKEVVKMQADSRGVNLDVKKQ